MRPMAKRGTKPAQFRQSKMSRMAPCSVSARCLWECACVHWGARRGGLHIRTHAHWTRRGAAGDRCLVTKGLKPSSNSAREEYGNGGAWAGAPDAGAFTSSATAARPGAAAYLHLKAGLLLQPAGGALRRPYCMRTVNHAHRESSTAPLSLLRSHATRPSTCTWHPISHHVISVECGQDRHNLLEQGTGQDL